MCLIALDWQPQAELQLAVIGNRDEFYARPSLPMAPWQEAPQLLAGRDLQAGGSWMGVTTGDRFAALTNFRQPGAVQGSLSRGALVADFLQQTNSPGDYCAQIAARASHYSPFNLLVADHRTLSLVDERGETQHLDAGSYSLSNGRLGDRWPKTERAAAQWQSALQAFRQSPPQSVDDFAHLLTALASREPAQADALPHTGIDHELEQQLSPCFIHFDGYGTRATTLYLRYRHQHIVAEQCFNEHGQPAGFSAYTSARQTRLGLWQLLGRIEPTDDNEAT